MSLTQYYWLQDGYNEKPRQVDISNVLCVNSAGAYVVS